MNSLKTIALLGIAVLSAAAQDQTGSIRGIVVDAVTRQPVRKAVVSLQLQAAFPTAAGANGNSLGGSLVMKATRLQPANGSIITDSSGTFAMDQIQPGSYRVTVYHQNYPQSRSGPVSAGKSFPVKFGETTGPLTMELTPGAALSGHVYDEDGDPLNGCGVQLHPARHPEQTAVSTASPALAGEGEYRLFGIAPGKYLLTVQCPVPIFQPRPLSTGPDPIPSLGYPVQFYPAGNSAESAEVIELTPGVERSGVDFRMKPVAVTSVRVMLAGEGRDRKDLGWRLSPPDPANYSTLSNWHSFNTGTGTLDIRQVYPGSYMLLVTTGIFGPRRPGDQAAGGVQRVDVKDKPVQIALELRPGVDINGNVEIENSNNGAIPIITWPNKAATDPEDGARMSPSQPGDVQPDGTFSLKSVLPLSSRVVITAPSAFLKSAWFGNTEVIGGRIDLTSGIAGPLRIVISTNTAGIHGTAPPGAQILAVSTERSSAAGFRGVQAHLNGQFVINGLAPGKYRVVTADMPGETLDEGGQEITLQEGETRTLELKADAAGR